MTACAVTFSVLENFEEAIKLVRFSILACRISEKPSRDVRLRSEILRIRPGADLMNWSADIMTKPFAIARRDALAQQQVHCARCSS